jgi:phage virion morphogenesis protein
MNARAHDLAAIEPWLAGALAPLSPGRRLLLSRRIGMLLRKINAARVTANVDPDGEPMTPRKARPERKPKKGRVPIRQRGKNGAMFRRIELARNMLVVPTADEVALTFRPRVLETAAIHHFGEVAPLNPKIANSIRTRYPARRLLGFNAADSNLILEQVMAHLEGRPL